MAENTDMLRCCTRDQTRRPEAFCSDCNIDICAICAYQHRVMRAFADHQLLDVKREDANQRCEAHKEELKLYCYKCNQLICGKCADELHQEHRHLCLNSKEAASQVKEKLKQQLNPLEEMKSKLSRAIESVKNAKSGVEFQRHHVRHKNTKRELVNIIRSHYQGIEQEIDTRFSSKLKHLSEQEKSLSEAFGDLQDMLDRMQNIMDHSSDDQILFKHEEHQSEISRTQQQHAEDMNLKLEPVEEVDIQLEANCVEDLKELCQNKIKVAFLSIDPTQCTVKFRKMGKAEVNEDFESSFIVCKKLTNGSQTKQKCDTRCQIRSLVSGSTTDCAVDLIEGSHNEYHIKCKPRDRGRHEITVTINGQQVGNPIPLFVAIHPAKLVEPVRTLGNLKNPTAVAIDSEDKIYVTEKDGGVVILDSQGEKLATFERPRLNLRVPRGVAIDSEDSVYFVDEKLKSIFKCKKGSTPVCYNNITVASATTGHNSVSVIGDDIVVFEYPNEGPIKVYDKDIQLKQVITPPIDSSECLHGIPKLTDVSSDGRGRWYVSDIWNHCIHVIERDGKYLHCLGKDTLNWPLGVCVSGDYVYATDFDKHKVFAFSIHGARDCVASIKSDFAYPWGVCVDRDGFLYICDSKNDRVQIF